MKLERIDSARQLANSPAPRSGGELATLNPKSSARHSFRLFDLQHGSNSVSFYGTTSVVQ
jgi:hypothetical protein